MNSVQRAANKMTVPNQKFNGARQRIQPPPQIGSKKRNLHTKDDESSRKRNATKHSRLFDMIQNPSIPISELTKAHTVPATTPGTLIAEDDEFAEVEITSQSALRDTAAYPLISELKKAHTVSTTPGTLIAEDDEFAEVEIISQSALGDAAAYQLISELTQAHIVSATTLGTLIAEDDDIAEVEITSQSALRNAAAYQLISELTQAHTVPATTSGTLIAEDDDIAEADITSHSHSGSTAVSQLSTLATHQDSTAGNPTSQTVGEAIIALQSGITAEQYPMISTVRTGVQSNIQDISEALTQDKGIEALGEQPYSKLPSSGLGPRLEAPEMPKPTSKQSTLGLGATEFIVSQTSLPASRHSSPNTPQSPSETQRPKVNLRLKWLPSEDEILSKHVRDNQRQDNQCQDWKAMKDGLQKVLPRRNLRACIHRYCAIRKKLGKVRDHQWLPSEDEILSKYIRDNQRQGKQLDWKAMKDGLERDLPERSLIACINRYVVVRNKQGRISTGRKKSNPRGWSGEEEKRLMQTIKSRRYISPEGWEGISQLFPGRSAKACHVRARQILGNEPADALKRVRRWTRDEDQRMFTLVSGQRWNDVPDDLWNEVSKAVGWPIPSCMYRLQKISVRWEAVGHIGCEEMTPDST